MLKSIRRLISSASEFVVRVRYMPKKASEADLKDVLSFEFKLEHFPNISLVKLTNEEDSAKAKKALKDLVFMGNTLRVDDTNQPKAKFDHLLNSPKDIPRSNVSGTDNTSNQQSHNSTETKGLPNKETYGTNIPTPNKNIKTLTQKSGPYSNYQFKLPTPSQKAENESGTPKTSSRIEFQNDDSQIPKEQLDIGSISKPLPYQKRSPYSTSTQKQTPYYTSEFPDERSAQINSNKPKQREASRQYHPRDRTGGSSPINDYPSTVKSSQSSSHDLDSSSEDHYGSSSIQKPRQPYDSNKSQFRYGANKTSSTSKRYKPKGDEKVEFSEDEYSGNSGPKIARSLETFHIRPDFSN